MTLSCTSNISVFMNEGRQTARTSVVRGVRERIFPNLAIFLIACNINTKKGGYPPVQKILPFSTKQVLFRRNIRTLLRLSGTVRAGGRGVLRFYKDISFA